MVDTDPAVFAISLGEADEGVPVWDVESGCSTEVDDVCEEVIEMLGDACALVLLS